LEKSTNYSSYTYIFEIVVAVTISRRNIETWKIYFMKLDVHLILYCSYTPYTY
jgi:hypothetical protein